MNPEPYICDTQDAAKIYDWLLHRGGIFIWRSINLSNPGASWTSPARDKDGHPATKPNWQCGHVPKRHITDLADVRVSTAREVKRFHVAVRMSGNGLSLKVSDGGSRRIRAEIEKAKQKYGRPAWYEFDYGAEKNCLILIEEMTVPMAEWVAKHKEAPCTC